VKRRDEGRQVDASWIERTSASRERLKALARLSDAELAQPVPGGWTVSGLLAHLAYWDARQIGVLEAWQRHGVPPAWWIGPEAHAVNEARRSLWLETAPRAALEQAIATAEAMDSLMQGLPPNLAEQIVGRRRERFAHRNEHLDAIEQALIS
jgi:hypothetical protein